MLRRSIRPAMCLALALLIAAATAHAAHAVYAVKHRLAEELAEIVRPVVGDVSVDARTNSLVIAGSRDQVDAALALLTERDIPARTVRVRVSFIEKDRLETTRLAIRTEYATAGFWIATVAGDPTESGFRASIAPDARHFTTDRRADQTLVVVEGGQATITTGRSVPVNRWLVESSESEGERVQWRSEIRVDTGFTVSPRILGDGKILLAIAPVASFLSDRDNKEIHYRNAQTTVTVAPGESVVIAGAENERGTFVSGMLTGFESEGVRSDWAMALQADVVD